MKYLLLFFSIYSYVTDGETEYNEAKGLPEDHETSKWYDLIPRGIIFKPIS